MVLSSLLLSLFIVAGIATEQAPPESLYKIIHIGFPKDRLTTQILRIQRDVYGITKFPCSSLLGPHCATNQALDEISTSTQTTPGTVQKRGGPSRANSLDIDSGQPLRKGELRGVWENIDPSILTEVADRVAEIAPVKNQEVFRHKVLSAFANVLARDENSEEEEDEVEEESKQEILNSISVHRDDGVVVRLEQGDIDMLLKAVQDTVVDLLKTDGTTDSTSNEEEDEDIYEDEEDEYED